jgi:hypothetical protein
VDAGTVTATDAGPVAVAVVIEADAPALDSVAREATRGRRAAPAAIEDRAAARAAVLAADAQIVDAAEATIRPAVRAGW